MQTILGSGGSISMHLVPALSAFTTGRIRLAGRNPQSYTNEETFKMDLLDAASTADAVEGSEVVYLLAGLPYDIRVWKADWPKVMENVIAACIKHKAKLVFLDNVYMYGLVKGWMNEGTSYNPCSRKGEVRAGIANRLMDAVKQGNLHALIARSADFLGPGATNTFMHPMIFMKFKEKKSAQWIANDKVKHSFSFTPDLGKAVALLGNTADAYDQVWHLPSAHDAVTGTEFISMAARAMGADPKYSLLKTWMMRLAAPFNRLAMESIEMAYQYEYEYLFDSSKFEKHFFKATPSAEALKLTAATY
ncbi:MAG: NAD-dependent dehydratase [Bacteroidetes bacterium]|nr:NAD-dependent dehydratase [Bacteroidota bacterium]